MPKRPDDDEPVVRRRNRKNPGTPVDQLGSGYPNANPIKEPEKKGVSGNPKGRPPIDEQPITKKMVRKANNVLNRLMTDPNVKDADALKAATYTFDRVFGRTTQNMNIKNESAETMADAMVELGKTLSTHALTAYGELEMRRLEIQEGKDHNVTIDVDPTEVKDED